MPLPVAAEHFSTGVWAADGPLRLRSCTCHVCGTRYASWEAFRQHRLGVALATAPCVPLERQTDSRPAWALGRLSGADRAALAALEAQLPDASPVDAALVIEEALT